MTKESLRKKIAEEFARYKFSNDKLTAEQRVERVLKVFVEKIQNAQRRVKDFVKHNPFYPPILSVRLFKEIDKIFLEEFGDKLI